MKNRTSVSPMGLIAKNKRLNAKIMGQSAKYIDRLACTNKTIKNPNTSLKRHH